MRLWRSLTLGLLATLMGVRTVASPLPFDYKDPKEISAISLMLDSKLEPIVGYARGISGTVNFDPRRPEATTGFIAVDVDSIQFANEGYTTTARGYALESDKYPRILFKLRKVLRVTRPSANVYRALVQADFICKGITLALTLPVTASYFPGMAEERTNGKYRGDVLVLRTRFNVSRTKLGISRGIPNNLVSDLVEVGVAIVGLHYAPGQKTDANAKQTSANLWKLEIEMRDDPMKVDAEFDLNALHPKATFTTAQESIQAEQVTLMGGKLAFHLPDNREIGAADGEAIVGENALHGFLLTKKSRLRFHARRKREIEDVIHSVPDNSPQGPGFRDLIIEANSAPGTLAERMRFHHVPAVSLARFENYKVVEVGAFGVANVETGEPVDANTLFQAGAMGNPLVNLLALRLAAEGRIDLNRAANSYLKTAKIPDNAFTRDRQITVLDLVNGASGLSQYKFNGYRPGVAVPSLPELMAGADPDEMAPLQAVRQPGIFDGEGVCGALLEQVIVDATGRSFAELMQEQIFTPLGMTHSTYARSPVGTLERKVALGHYSTGELMLDRFHIYPEAGETGLWTTASDFARMLCQIQLLLAGKPNRILTAGQRGLLKSVMGQPWTLGLIKADGKGFLPTDFCYHGGSSYGYYANHATHQWNGSGVVVMENRILGWALNNEIIKAVGTKHGWFIRQSAAANAPGPATAAAIRADGSAGRH